MRITFFSTYFDPYVSGMITSPFFLLRYLAQKGDKITVLTFPHKRDLPPEEISQGLHIIRMPYIFKISKGFISPFAPIFFLKELLRSDRIILNMPNFEATPLALLAFLFRKKIIGIYNCEVYLGKDLLSQCIMRFLNISIYIQLLFCHDIITYTKDYAASSTLLKKFQKKIHYIYPCIEIPRADKVFLKKLGEIKKRNVWIGCAGRIAREKGVECLIAACRELIQQYPALRIVFAGPSNVAGEQSYKIHIQTLLKKSHIPYYFFNDLSNDRFGSVLKVIDLLSLNSVNKTEAFGIVQVEAMLSGTPVTATNLPGVRVPIQLTHMGILTNPGDKKSLINAISAIIKQRKKYTNSFMIKNAKQIFSTGKIVEKYVKIIGNLRIP